jgi:hypothetical protein
VKSSLVLEYTRHDAPRTTAEYVFEEPFYEAQYDFRLEPL